MKNKKFNFNEMTSKLKDLNPKEYYDWPLAVQFGGGVLAFTGVVALGAFAHLIPKNEDLQTTIRKEETLKREFTDKKKQSVNLVLYVQQLEEVTKDSDELLKQLPDRSQMEKLLIDINQVAVSRGLKVELFKPGQEKLNEFYAELPINMKLTGSYDAIGNFTSDIAQLSRVVLFTDMEITTKDGLVSLTTLAKTFRYLDQEELQKQQEIKMAINKAKKKSKEKDKSSKEGK